MVRSNLVSISVGYPMPLQIILKNTQNVDTPSPFQQMLQLEASEINSVLPLSTPRVASDFHNIRFKYNNNYIPAWLESINNGVATIWVKLPVSIPANSSITINMEVDPSLNFDGNYWGEAPQLSKTYGQYDNGAGVFPFYDNFAGTSLSNNWITFKGSVDSYTVNNGITLINNESSDYIIIYSQSAVSPSGIFEMNVINGLNASPEIELAKINGIMYCGNGAVISYGYLNYFSMYSGQINMDIYNNSCYGTAYYNTNVYSSPFIQGIGWTATGSQLLELVPNYNYTNAIQIPLSDTSISLSTPLYVMFGQGTSSSTSNTGSFTVQWVRTRAYPPNNVMPSVEVIA